MDEVTTICVWPDGEWCWASELEEKLRAPMAKSDDFLRVQLPEWTDEDDCEWVAAHVQKHGVLPSAGVLAEYFGAA